MNGKSKKTKILGALELCLEIFLSPIFYIFRPHRGFLRNTKEKFYIILIIAFVVTILVLFLVYYEVVISWFTQ